MAMSVSACPVPGTTDQLQATFLTLLPRIEHQARLSFHDIPCDDRRAEHIAETIALAWKWFCRLAQRGKDARRFPTVLAQYAARAVRCGRRLCGQEKARDVLSRRAQHRHGFGVESLPASTSTSHETLYGTVRGQQLLDAYEERLRDNTQSPVPDQAAFRIDFPAWLTTLCDRDRRLVGDMALNHRTKELAHRYGLSEGRVSQMRRQFHDDWQRFCGEAAQE